MGIEHLIIPYESNIGYPADMVKYCEDIQDYALKYYFVEDLQCYYHSLEELYIHQDEYYIFEYIDNLENIKNTEYYQFLKCQKESLPFIKSVEMFAGIREPFDHRNDKGNYEAVYEYHKTEQYF